jgi:DNA-directed RNA polymerase subunit M/transcription elongation factor TFIIS
MSLKFCNVCETHLRFTVVKNNIVYICNRCKKEHKALPEDTLLYDENYQTKSDDIQIRNNIKGTAFDETNQGDDIDCPMCDNNFVKWDIDTNTGTKLYECRCGHRF